MHNVTVLKILVIGESENGKSSTILAFTTNSYQTLFPNTLVEFKSKIIDVNGGKMKLEIWNTAGHERLRPMTLTRSICFYRDAHGEIVVYDMSDPQNPAKLQEWIEKLQQYSTKKNILCLVVENNINKVQRSEGQAFAQKIMLFIESSAKTKEGIELALKELIQKVIETPELLETSVGSFRKHIHRRGIEIARVKK